MLGEVGHHQRNRRSCTELAVHQIRWTHGGRIRSGGADLLLPSEAIPDVSTRQTFHGRFVRRDWEKHLGVSLTCLGQIGRPITEPSRRSLIIPVVILYDVVGCGEVVADKHARILNRLRGEGLLKVRACIDTSPERAARMAKLLGAKPATSVTEAGAAGADAALIAAPPEYHADLAIHYLAEGRNVLIEKPFAPTLRDAAKLLDSAKRGGGRVLIGHQRRLYPAVRVARAVVRSGILGPIHSAEARDGGRWDWRAASSYVVTSPSGGVLFDTGSHVLDVLFYLLDFDDPDAAPAVDVKSIARDRKSEPSHDLSARFLLSRDGLELAVNFRVSRTEAVPQDIVLNGKYAALVVSGAFAQHPTVIAGGRAFRIDWPLSGPRPADLTGCYRLEHEAVADPALHPEVSASLDGSRFATLTGLLDTLANK